MNPDRVIGDWNRGTLSTVALLQKLEEHIRRAREISGLPYDATHHATLKRSLESLRDRRLQILSLQHFLQLATTRSNRERRLARRQRAALYQLEESADATRGPNPPATWISFASPAFAGKEAQETSGVSRLTALLDQIGQDNADRARLAVLRLFGGYTLNEIAARVQLSPATVRMQWEQLQALLLKAGLGHAGGIVLPPTEDLLRSIALDPRFLQVLDWRSFERLLGDLLDRLGYKIEVQKGTKDGGIDIIAISRSDILGDHRYLIQAKKWTHSVGVESVRELLFLQGHYRATKGCVATTSTFTRGAIQLGDEYRWQLALKDYRGIHEWVRAAVGL